MFFTCIAYGTNTPAGLFLPGMVIGCTYGYLYTILLQKWSLFPELLQDEGQLKEFSTNLIILGCGSMLAGYTRMTYSICVILMETSMRLNLFVPIVITVYMSDKVGMYFTRSLYERAVRGK